MESNADDVIAFRCSLNAINASPVVQIYETVAAALESFETAPLPDLIIASESPNIVQELRRIPGYEEVPVALFIHIDDMKQTPARLAGKASLLRVQGCLSRPVDDRQLRDLLNMVYREWRQQLMQQRRA